MWTPHACLTPSFPNQNALKEGRKQNKTEISQRTPKSLASTLHVCDKLVAKLGVAEKVTRFTLQRRPNAGRNLGTGRGPP